MKRTAEQFWKMLEPFHPEAESFCRRLTGNREDGDDLYQDSLLAALRKIATLRDPEAFRPWLYRIIVNRFRNRYREPWWKHVIPLTPELTETRTENDPSMDYDRRRMLEGALRALSPIERATVILFEIEGWSITELADLYRKPDGTIKSRLSRARSKMRKALRKNLPNSKTANQPSEGNYALQRGNTPAE
jgi:RNA polymerase sigma-70 factor (ECF subfamily)